MQRREQIAARIVTERSRHSDLPGREVDVRNSPNDWLAIVGHYLFEEVRRNIANPDRAAFEDGLVKAAAVIIAALEHADHMEADGKFSL